MTTIFALASAIGSAGIAVVRISGQQAGSILSEITCNPLSEARKAVLHKLFLPGEELPLDTAITLWFPSPNSFTGEDVVEFHLHGSPAIVKNLFSYLSSIENCRLAKPGEFSRRAFENGKLDLLQAEGLADLIESETEAQRKQASRQVTGELSSLLESWRQNIIHQQAMLEAYIDFPDETTSGIPANISNQLYTNLSSMNSVLVEYLSDKRGEKIRDGLTIAILGAPNAGKSSLLNYLARNEMAIVSEKAGTTRDIIEAHLDIAGYPVVICDTAGLRDISKEKNGLDPVEKEGIKKALERGENADIKICMFDATSLPELDKATLSLVDDNSIIVVNKIDKNTISDYLSIKNMPINAISILNSEGVSTFIGALEDRLREIMLPPIIPLITRHRHRELLGKVCACLENFLKNLKKETDIALLAEDLRLAARNISEISGIITTDDVLGAIFSDFCIGK